VAAGSIGGTAIVERLRGRAGQEQRLRRLKRTHGLCEDCQDEGRTEVAVEVDHVVPLAKGGSDEDGNTRNLCRLHHEAKTAKDFGFKHRLPVGIDGWPIESPKGAGGRQKSRG
jgi:5-methylcytosine-specific restriction protein A